MISGLRVEGLRELNRDLGRLSSKLQREFQREIRYKLAEPVAQDIRELATEEDWDAGNISTIRAGSRLGGAVVRQGHPKTTGRRGDFGALQMRKAFVPGLEANLDETEKRTEAFLSRLTAATGFGTLGGMARRAGL